MLTRAPASHFPQSETTVVESFLSGDEAVSEGKMEGAGSRSPLRAFLPPLPFRLANPRGGWKPLATSAYARNAARVPGSGKVAVERNRSHDESGATSVAPIHQSTSAGGSWWIEAHVSSDDSRSPTRATTSHPSRTRATAPRSRRSSRQWWHDGKDCMASRTTRTTPAAHHACCRRA